MSTICFVCEEYYRRDVNPAMTLVPCGHIACNPCITAWRKENNTCPQCRNPIQKIIINRGLMDVIEENKQRNDDQDYNATQQTEHVMKAKKCITRHVLHNNNTQQFAHKLSQKPRSTKNLNQEVIQDKCEAAIYIIDNSGSMEYYNDGKIFKNTSNNTIRKESGVLRWKEAASKVRKIAKYNISRNICASYYLLNPINKPTQSNTSWSNMFSVRGASYNASDWQQNVDYVVIDPNKDNHEMIAQKYNLLVDNIMSQDNVRSDTPLDVITRYFGRHLSTFMDMKLYGHRAICYNIITDGEPNDRKKFEDELKYLANHYNIFLTINLCTEDDAIVDYYNDLDKTIGKELSGFDVIDDLESEQKEIIHAGNTFFIYSEEIHICRMAGCFSIIADWMDEKQLAVYHACKLCNELCNFQRDFNDTFPDFNDREKYIKRIKDIVDRKPKVYDFANKIFGPIIDVEKLDYLIWFHEPTKNGMEYLYKIITYFMYKLPSAMHPMIMFVVIVFVYWLTY